MDRVEVVLAEQRQVGLGAAERRPGREIGSTGAARSSSASTLGRGEPRVERVGDRAELHQRVQEDDVLEPGRQHQRDGRAAPHAARGEPAGGGGRLALELGVGELEPRRRSARTRSGQVCGRWASQLSRIIGATKVT